MLRQLLVAVGLMAALCGAGISTLAADDSLDKAFEALKAYDWGKERAPLRPLEEAVAAAGKDAALAKALEKKLVELLKSDVSQAAKDQICRQLSLVGSADCVPAVAELLPDEKLSHMARYVLERIPAPEASKALREALGKTKGVQKVGVLNSLGVKRDAESLPAIVPLLADSDPQIAAAAAAALGAIGTSEAAKALADFQGKAPEALKLAAADAYLACAEALLAAGKKAEALAIYKELTKSEIRHVKLAATRGMMSVMGKKQ